MVVLAQLNALPETVLFFEIGFKEASSVPSAEHYSYPIEDVGFFPGTQAHDGRKEVEALPGGFLSRLLEPQRVADVAPRSFFRGVPVLFRVLEPAMFIIWPLDQSKSHDPRDFLGFIKPEDVLVCGMDIGIIEIARESIGFLELIHDIEGVRRAADMDENCLTFHGAIVIFLKMEVKRPGSKRRVLKLL
jgi:hypothetical protein